MKSCRSTIEEMGNGYNVYCRTRSIKREELENAFLALYGVTSETHIPFIFPSGMSAISTIMHCFATQESRFVLGSEHYCDTPKVAKLLCHKKLLSTDPDANISLIFMETSSNPSGYVPDYVKIAKMKNANLDTVVCLDNTWLTGAMFNPFTENVPCDIVVESMSKYLSAGQCIGGMCIAKIQYAAVITQHIRHHGLHVTSETCELVLQTLPFLYDRVKNAMDIAANMRNELGIVANMRNELGIVAVGNIIPAVFTITYPLPHPILNPEKKKKVQKGKVRCVIQRLCNENGIRYETSFGAAYSKIDCFPEITDTHVRFRIAAGYSKDGSEDRIVKLLKELL